MPAQSAIEIDAVAVADINISHSRLRLLFCANVGANRPRGTPKVFVLADHLPCATCLRSGSVTCYSEVWLRVSKADYRFAFLYAILFLLPKCSSLRITSALTGRAMPLKYSTLPTTFLAPRACGPVQRLVRADLPHLANTIRARYPQHVACEAVVLKGRAAILRLMIMRFISFSAVDGRP